MDFSPFDSVQECKQLRTLVIQAPITKFDGLQDCPNITAIQLPETVETVNGLTSRSVPLLTDIYFCGTAEQWMNRYCLALENLTVHCSDATMRYEGMFFQEFLEFDGAWWLESTILPDYAEGVEMPVQEEPAREEKPKMRKPISMDDPVLDRVLHHAVYRDGRVCVDTYIVYDFLYNEQGNPWRKTQYSFGTPDTDMFFDYDQQDRPAMFTLSQYDHERGAFTVLGSCNYEYNKLDKPVRCVFSRGNGQENYAYDKHGTLTNICAIDKYGEKEDYFGPYEYDYNSDGAIIAAREIDDYGDTWDCDIPSVLLRDIPAEGLLYWAIMYDTQRQSELTVCYINDGVPPDERRIEYDNQGRICRIYGIDWNRDGSHEEFMRFEFEYMKDGRTFCWGFEPPDEDDWKVGVPSELLILEYAPLSSQMVERQNVWDVPDMPEEYYYGNLPADD